MKTNMKVFLSAIGVAALLAFPALTKAQVGFQNRVFPPTRRLQLRLLHRPRRLTALFP